MALAVILVKTAYAQHTTSLASRLIQSAIDQTQQLVIYDSRYRAIAYPMGDVPVTYGVCSDVLVRAYRTIGIDLQQLVHEDMKNNFNLYPTIWGLKKPDTNIDHRRVPNLETFFKRHGKVLVISSNGTDYQPGDIVSWRIPVPHIGLVTHLKSADGKRPLIAH
ncbi:MAG: DUF1287 domain-containing protein, partial [Alphaproteobacteria bacterium]|nr:DUF1287 domain-containing protein [Alphaproteobacteria bacterium]